MDLINFKNWYDRSLVRSAPVFFEQIVWSCQCFGLIFESAQWIYRSLGTHVLILILTEASERWNIPHFANSWNTAYSSGLWIHSVSEWSLLTSMHLNLWIEIRAQEMPPYQERNFPVQIRGSTIRSQQIVLKMRTKLNQSAERTFCEKRLMHSIHNPRAYQLSDSCRKGGTQ